MKKKIVFVSIILLGCYYLYSFTSDNKKYEIINEIIRDNNLHLNKICSKSEKIEIFKNNLNDFTLLEQLSVTFQKITQTEDVFEPNKLKYLNLESNKTASCEVITNCDNKHEIIYRISMPIVSPDKESVVIKIIEDCNCLLGGQGGEYLYKKINGKWKKIKSFNKWIS